MEKISTGIKGLDDILKGGYPKHCPTLLKAGPGCGKTVFSLLFAHRNIINERHTTFITCDESPESILRNMDQYDLSGSKAVKEKKLSVLDFRPNLFDSVTGSFELDAILLRIKTSLSGTDPVLIIDSLQNLLIGLETPDYKRDLLKLFDWCKENRITLLVTAASGLITEEDNYFEEYAADCVILMEQVLRKNLMTRFLRILKMRGSQHGTNQYPFLLTRSGVSIFPITETSIGIRKKASYITTGIKKLDEMFGGKGYMESSTVMISGASGTAKSILSSSLALAAAKQQKKVLFLSLEESPANFIDNVKSAGVNLNEFIESGLLTISSVRSIQLGLEEHLIMLLNRITAEKPDVLIIDPITSFLDIGSALEVKSLLIRLISYAKTENITFIFNQFLREFDDHKDIIALSSLVDVWIKLQLVESEGEFNRALHLVKARGHATSSQIKEFHITNNGLKIDDPYIGQGGMIFGSQKAVKQALDLKLQESLSNRLLLLNEQINLLEEAFQKESKPEYIKQLMTLFELRERKEGVEMEIASSKSINAANIKSRG